MTAVYLEALVAMALALSILMALAWVVQQRTGNSGWDDTTRTFAVGPVRARGALWPGSTRMRRNGWLPALLLAPILMFCILVYVTGIPPLGGANAETARQSLSSLSGADQQVLSPAASA